MNDSGRAVRPLLKRFGIKDLSRLIVIHDELDLPVGRLKVKLGGGLAGHNGLRSIRSHCHSVDFMRVRIGIGKPTGAANNDFLGDNLLTNYVLGKPGKTERAELDQVVVRAANAVESLIRHGLEPTMNQYNTP